LSPWTWLVGAACSAWRFENTWFAQDHCRFCVVNFALFMNLFCNTVTFSIQTFSLHGSNPINVTFCTGREWQFHVSSHSMPR
jgi:hypothetical protein